MVIGPSALNLLHCPLRRRDSLAMRRGMDMGEALTAMIDPLEDHAMSEEGERVLYGDSEAGIQILLCPDGPFRKRHLRLLAFVLRERIKKEWWKARHLRGEVLVPDPSPRQSQMQKSEWEKFYLLAGMVVPDEEKRAPYFKKIKSLVGVMAGLGMWKPTSAEQRRRRSSCIASLAAGLAVVVSKRCRVGGGKNGQKWSREDEPGQPSTLRAQHETSGGGRSQEGPMGDEPGQFPNPTPALSLNGSRYWARPRGKPWDRGSDQTGCSALGPQEIVGVGGASSPTKCHPPHRSTPFPLEALGPERTMVAFVFTTDGRGGRWVRSIYTDRWASGVPQELDGGVLGQWKGFTVFRLERKMMPGETMRQQGENITNPAVDPRPPLPRRRAEDLLHMRPPAPRYRGYPITVAAEGTTSSASSIGDSRSRSSIRDSRSRSLISEATHRGTRSKVASMSGGFREARQEELRQDALARAGGNLVDSPTEPPSSPLPPGLDMMRPTCRGGASGSSGARGRIAVQSPVELGMRPWTAEDVAYGFQLLDGDGEKLRRVVGFPSQLLKLAGQSLPRI